VRVRACTCVYARVHTAQRYKVHVCRGSARRGRPVINDSRFLAPFAFSALTLTLGEESLAIVQALPNPCFMTRLENTSLAKFVRLARGCRRARRRRRAAESHRKVSIDRELLHRSDRFTASTTLSVFLSVGAIPSGNRNESIDVPLMEIHRRRSKEMEEKREIPRRYSRRTHQSP